MSHALDAYESAFYGDGGFPPPQKQPTFKVYKNCRIRHRTEKACLIEQDWNETRDPRFRLFWMPKRYVMDKPDGTFLLHTGIFSKNCCSGWYERQDGTKYER